MGFRQILYGILMWAVFVYALRRGAWAERLAAAGIIANAYLSFLLITPMSDRFKHLEAPVMLVDVALFVLLLFISLRSEKFWPLWLTAMHGLTTLAHFSPYVPHMQPLGYWRAAASWSWPMLLVLAIGIRCHHLDRRIRDRFRL